MVFPVKSERVYYKKRTLAVKCRHSGLPHSCRELSLSQSSVRPDVEFGCADMELSHSDVES